MNTIDKKGQNNSNKKNRKNILWLDRQFAYPQRTIRLATTFSGIGAIEYAFKRLGLKHEIIFAGDINDKCKESYFTNYTIKDEQWHSDVHDFNAKPYRNKVDLLVGGAPCQAFSIVGDKRGFEDTRGTLFREFARIIKECKPKVFIFENVQGLLQHDNGKTWDVIYNTFKDYCGYDVHYQLLNARDYGMPQTRERLYCIGFRKKTSFVYPTPIPLKYKMYDFLEDYAGGDYYDVESNTKRLSDDNEIRITEVKDKYYLTEKVARYVLCSGTKTFKTPIKTDLDIARPLLQSMHKMHRAGIDNYVTYNKSKGINGLRRLTPRECLRLMGFRDDFQIVVSDTSMYMQAGNSIVVDVLIALLKQMDITKYGIDDEK